MENRITKSENETKHEQSENDFWSPEKCLPKTQDSDDNSDPVKEWISRKRKYLKKRRLLIKSKDLFSTKETNQSRERWEELCQKRKCTVQKQRSKLKKQKVKSSKLRQNAKPKRRKKRRKRRRIEASEIHLRLYKDAQDKHQKSKLNVQLVSSQVRQMCLVRPNHDPNTKEFSLPK